MWAPALTIAQFSFSHSRSKKSSKWLPKAVKMRPEALKKLSGEGLKKMSQKVSKMVSKSYQNGGPKHSKSSPESVKQHPNTYSFLAFFWGQKELTIVNIIKNRVPGEPLARGSSERVQEAWGSFLRDCWVMFHRFWKCYVILLTFCCRVLLAVCAALVC